MGDRLADSILGRFAYWLWLDGPAAVVNHLWQSTLFALAIGLLVLLLRRNSARVRYVLWLAASLKFLLPFAALAFAGSMIAPQRHASGPAAAVPELLQTAGNFAAPVEPVADHWQLIEPRMTNGPEPVLLQYETLVLLLTLAWILGSLVVAARWLRRWRSIRRTLRAAAIFSGVEFPVPVRATTEALEPGIVGIARPVLLLPAGMDERLTPEQMRAVLAHERCHLHRRDNLTAALHMLVETLFWFHPLVWWIGARLIHERECACDEQVVREGHAPQSYAEAILRVCEHYIASRLPCVSGVSGSGLRKRVERIVGQALVARLTASRRLILAALACAAVATPIAAGIATWRSHQGRSLYRSASTQYWSLLEVDEAGPPLCAPRSRSLGRRQVRLARTVAGLRAADGERVLLFAVMANSAADVRRLLADGASHTGDGFLLEESLMHVAAQFADPQVLQALLDAGFDVNGLAAPLGAGPESSLAHSPLTVAITSGRKDNADWLVQRGADVNAGSGGASSPLTRAMAVCKDQALASMLLRAGARPDDQARRVADNMGFTLDAPNVAGSSRPATRPASPYEEAVRLARAVDAAQLRAGPTCPGRSRDTRQAQLELRRTVSTLASGDGANVLLYAVMADSEPDVRRLLASAAPRDGENRSAPQAAARFAGAHVLQALADAGFSLESGDGRTGTPLLAAVGAGRTDNVAWLLEHGGGARTADGAGWATGALRYAMSCRSQVLVNLLLRAGARIDASVRNSADWYGPDLRTGEDALTRGTLDPPRGWNFPDIDLLASDANRSDSPLLFVEAREDFDGDGKEDHAALFVAADGRREGLFLKLSSADPDTWTMAATVDHSASSRSLAMGISVMEPGTHATACAKGHGRPCEESGEPAEAVLQEPGLLYFQFESAASVIYWDRDTRTFKRTWISG